jgi:hypothetical protein
METGMNIPMQLIQSMTVEHLRYLLAYLNRTRKRLFRFCFNGSSVFTSRRWARDAVKAELALRLEL